MASPFLYTDVFIGILILEDIIISLKSSMLPTVSAGALPPAKAVTFGVKSGQLGSTESHPGSCRRHLQMGLSLGCFPAQKMFPHRQMLLNVGSAQVSVDTQPSTVVLGSNACFCTPC